MLYVRKACFIIGRHRRKLAGSLVHWFKTTRRRKPFDVSIWYHTNGAPFFFFLILFLCVVTRRPQRRSERASWDHFDLLHFAHVQGHVPMRHARLSPQKLLPFHPFELSLGKMWLIKSARIGRPLIAVLCRKHVFAVRVARTARKLHAKFGRLFQATLSVYLNSGMTRTSHSWYISAIAVLLLWSVSNSYKISA